MKVATGVAFTITPVWALLHLWLPDGRAHPSRTRQGATKHSKAATRHKKLPPQPSACLFRRLHPPWQPCAHKSRANVHHQLTPSAVLANDGPNRNGVGDRVKN